MDFRKLRSYNIQIGKVKLSSIWVIWDVQLCHQSKCSSWASCGAGLNVGSGLSSSGRFSWRQTVALSVRLSVCLRFSLGLWSALVSSVWACSGCSVGRAARQGRWMRQSPPSAVYNFWISPLVIFTYSYVTPRTCIIASDKNLFMCTLKFLPHGHETVMYQGKLTKQCLLDCLSSRCSCVTHSSCKRPPPSVFLMHFFPSAVTFLSRDLGTSRVTPWLNEGRQTVRKVKVACVPSGSWTTSHQWVTVYV